MNSRGSSTTVSTRTRAFTLVWVALFAMSVLLQYARVLATADPVRAASGLKAGTVQGFEVDGDPVSGNAASNPGNIPAGQIDGTLTNGDDWLIGATGTGVVDPASPPVSKLIDDPANSNSDSQFIGGAKELDTCTWGYDTGPVTPKDDIKHVMAYAKLVGSSGFFYMGAERIINNGDTHVDFELNQKPFTTFPGAPGVAKPNRTLNDLIVALEFSNGGSVPQVTVWKVTAVSNCSKSGQVAGQTVTVTDITTSASVHSATNFLDLASIKWPDEASAYTVPSFEFAEASVDLASLGIQTSCPGLSAGSMRTRAGGDINSSQLKDRVPEFPIDLNNCGKLRIEKHAGSLTGPLQGGATFTITDDPRPGQSGTLTIVDNDANDANSAAGIVDIDPADPGTYTVCETVAPAGYKLPTPACQQVTVPNNGTFANATVKFADPRKTATTTLQTQSASPANGSQIPVGQPITLVVRETNTGEMTLSSVNVTGTNSCATTGTTAGTWVAAANKVGGGAFSGTLATGEAVDFTCTFAAGSSSFSWSATGHGTDELGAPASLDNETVSGNYVVIHPATTLTLVSAPTQVEAGGQATVVVTEANSGDATLTSVNVTGTGSCGSYTAAGTKNGGGAFTGSLSAGESVNFSCTFTPTLDPTNWSATGHGTDPLGAAAPLTNETVNGAIDILHPATVLTLVSAPTQVEAGSQATVIVMEQNTGDITLSNVNVTGTNSCANYTAATTKNGGGAFSGSLGPLESVNFSCSFTPTLDPTNWSATGHGTDPLQVAAPLTNETVNGAIDVLHPATQLTLVSAPTQVEAGSQVTIIVREQNTGDIALSSVNVSGTNSCATTGTTAGTWVAAATKNGGGAFAGSLGPGESVNFSCTFTPTLDPTSWSATGHGTDPLQVAAPLTNETVNGAIDLLHPATTLTLVSAGPDPVLQHGSVTIVVREQNTGDITLSNVNVTGSPCASYTAAGTKNGGGPFTGSLAPGESVNFTCSVADVGTANPFNWSALGHGTDPLQTPAPDTNESQAGSIHVVNPNIDVVKTAGASLGSQVADGTVYNTLDGSTVVYKYVVTTQDPDGLTAVQVTDDTCSPVTAVTSGGHNVGDTNSNDKLEPGESWVFQCSTALSLATDGANVHNTATASGQPLTGPRISAEDTADVHLVQPSIDVVKTAGASLGSQVADGTVYNTLDGSTVVYKYVVTTQDPDGLTAVQVTDDTCSPVTAVTSGGHNVGDLNLDDTLQPGESWVFQCSTTLSVVEGDANVHNTATATGQPLVGPSVSAQDTADVHLVQPGIGVVKTAGASLGSQAANGSVYTTQDGSTVVYKYVVTTQDPDGLTAVQVTDDTCSPVTAVTSAGHNVGDTNSNDKLEVGESWVFQCSKALTISIDGADVHNTATASGQPLVGPRISAQDGADVHLVVPALTLAKTIVAVNGLAPVLDSKGRPVVGDNDVVTYKLTWTLTNGPVTNADLTDDLPEGLTYVGGTQSSTPAADSFSYNSTTRILEWKFTVLSVSGSATYKAKVDAGTEARAGTTGLELKNVAVIKSDQTPPSSDNKTVDVPAGQVLALTPPPTATGSEEPGTGSGSALLVLLLLLIGSLGLFLTIPLPRRIRR